MLLVITHNTSHNHSLAGNGSIIRNPSRRLNFRNKYNTSIINFKQHSTIVQKIQHSNNHIITYNMPKFLVKESIHTIRSWSFCWSYLEQRCFDFFRTIFIGQYFLHILHHLVLYCIKTFIHLITSA